MGLNQPRALLLVIACLPLTLKAQDAPGASAARLVEKENVVEAQKRGMQWRPTTLGLDFALGDRLRTGEFSRAAVRFTDLSVLRLDELTTIEISGPAASRGKQTLDVKKGGTYFFSREKANEMQIRSPAANGALRGTEFDLRVATNGRTTMTMFEGEVELSNAHGRLLLKSGEQGEVEPGKAPRRTAVIDAVNVIQWCLYYPGVIDPESLAFTRDEQQTLSASLAAYREGDLLGALARHPRTPAGASHSARLYQAATALSAGQVASAQTALAKVPAQHPGRLALEQMIAAVKFKEWTRNGQPGTASEWMAESYYRQSRSDLTGALHAARQATELSPKFAFAWVRLAELSFSFGRTQDAGKALDRGIALAARNAQAMALRGFLLSAENRIAAAQRSFDESITLDGALGNAWLGCGLTSIRLGHAAEGRRDLQVAAALEPSRSILRSYLGKAFSETHNTAKASVELKRAVELDPNDPTPWLYSAIQRKQENRYNEAVADLERSTELNDNRRLYRSRFLLDEDRAVRGANLASIYLNAGLQEQSVREAVRAVASDPGSAPAHLFLANSYNSLRDPERIQLRYETAWYNELLLSHLLSPVGGGPLSQYVSEQEYSKLFEKDGVGGSSLFEYLSTGQLRETASVYGTSGNVSYALDSLYQNNRGVRTNNGLSNLNASASFKLQLGPQDSIFLRTEFVRLSTGDVFQRYDQGEVNGAQVTLPDGSTKFVPNRAAQSFHQHEDQDPGLVLLGWHHQWSPGNHTILLLGRLATRQEIRVDGTTVPTVLRDVIGLAPEGLENEVGITIPRDSALFSSLLPLVGKGKIFGYSPNNFDLDYHSQFESYTAEIQQIVTFGTNNLLLGARYQSGRFDTQVRLSNYNNGSRPFEVPLFQNPPASQDYSVDLERVNLYLYDTWKVTRWLAVTGGVTYDSLAYPDNFRSPPIDGRQANLSRVSPKAGLIVQPWHGATVRAGYAEAISGASFDESVRLEPTQVAGFVQAYRSLASESIIGSVAGSRLRIAGVSVEQTLPSRLYLGFGLERREQRLGRTIGAFDDLDVFGTPLAVLPSSLAERIRYREDSLTATVNKLIGQNWSLGARYRYTDSDLAREVPALARALGKSQDSGQVDGLARASGGHQQSGLHELDFYAIYNHPCGFFARAEANYYRQTNADYVRGAAMSDPDFNGMSHAIVSTTNQGLPGDDFWQFNILAGYRFSRNQCEVSVGALNLADRDYHLSPVNPYDELPRERTFVVRCKLAF